MLTKRYREVAILAMLAALRPTPAHAASGTDAIDFTATSANVKEPGSPVKIHLIRWSTDDERTPIVAALNPAATAAPATAGAVPPAGTGLPPGLPAGAGVTTSAAAGAGANPTAAGGRGRAGRGGRGGARGGRGAGDTPPNPIAALTAAIGRAPTVGYIWTTDVTGYSIKYAYHASLPDGSERIILATDRRLGAYSPAWKPVSAEAAANAPAADYDFTLVEIHLDARGSGEGKSSLTTRVVADNEAKTVALEHYATVPAILQKVEKLKVQNGK